MQEHCGLLSSPTVQTPYRPASLDLHCPSHGSANRRLVAQLQDYMLPVCLVPIIQGPELLVHKLFNPQLLGRPAVN
jgi:hypothetical protein